MGGRSKAGYGAARGMDGRQTTASRVVWEVEVGPIPPGAQVLHTCDNPPCVRRSHLFLGTQAENLEDMRAKGRAPKSYNHPPQRGDRNHNAKLSDEQVAEMRRLFDGGARQSDLMRQFGTTRGNVHSIVRRKSRV